MLEKILICYSEAKDSKKECVNNLKMLLENKYRISDITVYKVEDNIEINIEEEDN